MLPVVLDRDYRKDVNVKIEYKPYQFLPFMEIFEKNENGFELKQEQQQLIINDDHGIGIKTETGIILSQLLNNKPDLRVVILAFEPDILLWEELMYENFGLDFHEYGENGKCDSDLLIVSYNKMSKINLDEFDVQIVYELNYYRKDSQEEYWNRLISSENYRLRILIYSDHLLDNKDAITYTNTSSITANKFNITMIQECYNGKGEKTTHLKKYLEEKCLKERKFDKVVIFSLSDYDKELVETLGAEGLYKVIPITKDMKFSERKKQELAFSTECSAGTLLVCTHPYDLDLSFCDTAIYYDIMSESYENVCNGVICKANRDGDVDIIYFVDETNEKKADIVQQRIKAHEEKQEKKEKDREEIQTKVENYLTMLGNNENTADKKQLEELKKLREQKGEQQ